MQEDAIDSPLPFRIASHAASITFEVWTEQGHLTCPGFNERCRMDRCELAARSLVPFPEVSLCLEHLTLTPPTNFVGHFSLGVAMDDLSGGRTSLLFDAQVLAVNDVPVLWTTDEPVAYLYNNETFDFSSFRVSDIDDAEGNVEVRCLHGTLEAIPGTMAIPLIQRIYPLPPYWITEIELAGAFAELTAALGFLRYSPSPWCIGPWRCFIIRFRNGYSATADATCSDRLAGGRTRRHPDTACVPCGFSDVPLLAVLSPRWGELGGPKSERKSEQVVGSFEGTDRRSGHSVGY